jgi:hypothetical protein
VPDWLIFGITIKNGNAGELQPNVEREMTSGGAEIVELPLHGSHDFSAATGTTLRHWGYALTNTISIQVVLGPY